MEQTQTTSKHMDSTGSLVCLQLLCVCTLSSLTCAATESCKLKVGGSASLHCSCAQTTVRLHVQAQFTELLQTAQFDEQQRRLEAFRPAYQSLVGVIAQHMQYPSDYLEWQKDDLDDFKHYRYSLAETLEDVAGTQPFSTLPTLTLYRTKSRCLGSDSTLL